MLKKALLYIVFLLFGFTQQIIAQCPVSIDIVPDKTGDLCRNTLVSLTAQPTNGGTNPDYFWIINGDSVGTTANISTSTRNPPGIICNLVLPFSLELTTIRRCSCPLAHLHPGLPHFRLSS